MPDLNIHFQPKQDIAIDMLEVEKYDRLGMGGARGGAKSGFLRRALLLRRLTYENTTGIILRRTYPELYKSHIVKLFEEYPEIRQYWNEQKKELFLPRLNSRLFMGSAEHPGDMAQYHSVEFADIGIDEAQEFSQAEIESLAGSNRCTSNSRIVPCMMYTFMPGVSESGLPPIGLDYLKRVFIDKIYRAEEKRHKWGFVQAFAWDNIEWARKELGWEKSGREWVLQPGGVSEREFYYGWDEARRRQFFIENTEFGGQLSGITSKSLREAWLFGKWDTFEGKYFDNFSFDKNTRPPEEIEIRKWFRFWLSGDWGDYHPAVFYLHAKGDDGKILTIDEVYGRHMSEESMGKEIGAMCARHRVTSIEEFILGWDAFGKINKRTQRPITEMISEFLPSFIPYPIPSDSAPGSRVPGWRYMKQVMESYRWIISRKCEKLIECIPTLVRDMDRNTEDILKVDWSENYVGDDPGDAARYGLQYEQRDGTKPAAEKAAEKVKAYAESRGVEVEDLDINSVAMIHRHEMNVQNRLRKQRRGGLGRVWHPQYS